MRWPWPPVCPSPSLQSLITSTECYRLKIKAVNNGGITCGKSDNGYNVEIMYVAAHRLLSQKQTPGFLFANSKKQEDFTANKLIV